jgi:hypothetical protein
MTDKLTQEAPALVGIGAQSIVDRAKELGLTWTLRPATVTRVGDSVTTTEVVYDGDTVAVGCVNLTGSDVRLSQRVMGMMIPPSGNFIIGLLGSNDWLPFVFQNGWHNSNPTTAVSAQYRRLAPNCVQLIGEIASGTIANNTIVTNLPAGYRPRFITSYTISCNPSPAAGVVGPLMQLKPNGDIVIWGATTGSAYFSAILPLDA